MSKDCEDEVMDFLHYYSIDNPSIQPFQMFSIHHLIFLFTVVLIIGLGLYSLKNCQKKKLYLIEKIIATSLIIGEQLYTIWIMFVCPYPIYTEILPLHLCSICFYLSAVAIFLDNEKLRKFIAVNGLFGGIIAMCYPANISGIFPTLSYRVIYFYISHTMIVFISLLQLKQITCLKIKDVRFHMTLISIFLTLAIFINYFLHTNYLFVGFPSTIGFIQIVYNIVGLWLYLPTAIVIFTMIEIILILILKKVQKVLIKDIT